MNKIFPSDWKWIKFNDLFQVAIGGTPSRSNPDYWDEEKKTKNKWVSIRDLKGKYIFDTSEYLSDLGVKNSNVKLVPKGTIMMSFKLTVGRTAYAGDNLFTNEAIAAFIPKKNNLVSLGYFYQGLNFWNLLENSDQAVKGVTLNKEKINELQGLFPPLPEQQKIAAILTAVDEVIASTQAQISKLKDLKTAMMQELLTKGIGHTEFKGSPVGRIPASWGFKRLEDVATIQTGAAKNSKVEGDLVDIPYLRVANVQDGYLDLTEIKLISIEKSRVQRFLLQPEDVLVNEGGDFDKLGRGHVWHGQIDPCIHQNHVFVVRTDKKYLLPLFFNFLSGAEIGKNYYLGCAKQTTNLASINSTQLKQFPVLLPSIEEQRDICNHLQAVDSKLDLLKLNLEQKQNVKKALMQDLLTGKVRVALSSI